MTRYDFTDQVVMITGAGSGFGRLAAGAFADAGALLALCDLDPEALQDTVRLHGLDQDRVLTMGCDVSAATAVDAFVAACVARFGQIDVAINNAGIGHDLKRLADLDEATFDRNIAVNLKGVFLCMRAQLPQMVAQGGGAILNVSSVAGLLGAPMMAAYSAAKHGVIGLTKSAALEYARKHVRVNALCPAFTRTPILDPLVQSGRGNTLDNMAAAIPMGRLGEPAEIVQAMLWACSRENSFLTGQAITLDGGMSAG